MNINQLNGGLVIKHHHLATPPTHLFDDVILEWSLTRIAEDAMVYPKN